ncbi:hypothetical protein IKG20_00090 [Candidatus Saccharibacteria bacterium]|nr:hypothetical protein [Candidatus Saccharibacteria bacterium]
MDKNIIFAAEQLLREPKKLEEIPIQRAVAALDISALTVGHNHEYYHVEYLIYPNNLYFIFNGLAPKDENGNFESPIFQDSRYNGTKPLWQEFRERIEEKWGTSVSLVFFGTYKDEGQGEEFFTVKDEPGKCRWCYSKKTSKDSVFIKSISKKEALEYQAILDDIRLEHAVRIVENNLARERSRTCREEAIMSLDSDYPDEFERFTFEDEFFRFRQFRTEFLYTPEGRKAFDEFYIKVCVPYRKDEIEEFEWEEKSHELKNRLMADDELEPEFRLYGADNFKITRLEDGRCKVESDLVDDRTGHTFYLEVDSQKFDEILNTVISELTIVFQRKRQIRKATATLQSLASKK